MRRLILLAGLLSVCIAAPARSGAREPAYWLPAAVATGFPHITGVVVLQNGEVLVERYFGVGSPAHRAHVHSVTKSVIAALVGIAGADGRLPGPDAGLDALLPDRDLTGDPRLAGITLDSLLTMTAGFRWSEQGEAFFDWRYRRDRLAATLRLPIADPPGRRFVYSTAVSHLLGAALAEAVGEDPLDYANRRLLHPVGILDAAWSVDPLGFRTGGTGLQLTVRDMARFGQLVLDRGVRDGVRILPDGWVDRMTRPRIAVGDGLAYGYHWWIRDIAGCASAYAWGRGGQFIVVTPEKRAVLAIASTPHADRPSGDYLVLLDRLGAAVPGTCDPARTLGHRLRSGDPAIRRTAAPVDVDGVPTAVRAWLDRFSRTVLSGDLDALMRLYDDAYLFDGMTKAGRREAWRRVLSQITQFDMVVVDYSEDGGRPRLLLDVRTNQGTVSAEAHLRPTSHGFAMLGNLRGGSAPVAVGAGIQRLLDRTADAIEDGDRAAFTAQFDPDYLSNGFDRDQVTAFLWQYLSQVGSATPVVTAIRDTGSGVALDGFLATDTFGRMPLKQLLGHARRAGDAWRWIGNRAPD